MLNRNKKEAIIIPDSHLKIKNLPTLYWLKKQPLALSVSVLATIWAAQMVRKLLQTRRRRNLAIQHLWNCLEITRTRTEIEKIMKIKRSSCRVIQQSQILTSITVIRIWLPGALQPGFITRVLNSIIMMKIKAKVILKERRHLILRKLEIGDNFSTRKS